MCILIMSDCFVSVSVFLICTWFGAKRKCHILLSNSLSYVFSPCFLSVIIEFFLSCSISLPCIMNFNSTFVFAKEHQIFNPRQIAWLYQILQISISMKISRVLQEYDTFRLYFPSPQSNSLLNAILKDFKIISSTLSKWLKSGKSANEGLQQP